MFRSVASKAVHDCASSPGAAWQHAAWWSVWALSPFTAALLALRRLNGALAAEPPLFAVLGLGVLGLAGTVAAMVVCLSVAGPRAGEWAPARRWLAWVLGAAPSAATCATGWAVWLPGSNGWTQSVLLACAVVQAALLYAGARAMRWPRRSGLGRQAARMPPRAVEEGCRRQSAWPGEVQRIKQQIIRGYDAAGRELAVGSVSLAFPRGCQQAAAHVAFCPPLVGVPQVECRQQSGPLVRLKVTQRAAFGARIEARLPQPAQECVDVQVQFVASVAEPEGGTATAGWAVTEATAAGTIAGGAAPHVVGGAGVMGSADAGGPRLDQPGTA